MTRARTISAPVAPRPHDLDPERIRAVRSIAAGTGAYGRAWLPCPPDAAAAGFGPESGRSYLSANRTRVYLQANLDRCVCLAGEPYDLAWRLASVGVLRLFAATPRRRHYGYGAGFFTNVHCRRAEALDVFAALAAIDVAATGPAAALVQQWAGDVRQLAQDRPPKLRTWLLDQLAQDLTASGPVPTRAVSTR